MSGIDSPDAPRLVPLNSTVAKWGAVLGTCDRCGAPIARVVYVDLDACDEGRVLGADSAGAFDLDGAANPAARHRCAASAPAPVDNR